MVSEDETVLAVYLSKVKNEAIVHRPVVLLVFINVHFD